MARESYRAKPRGGQTDELDITLLGIVGTGVKARLSPKRQSVVENPKLSPALE